MSAIYIDLDGTLVDIRMRHCGVYQDVSASLGIPAVHAEEYWTRRRLGAASAELVGSADGKLRARFLDAWIGQIELPANLRLDTVMPGAVEALDGLRECFSLVLVTLRRERLALERQLEELGLRRHFDAVLSPSGSTSSKAALIQEFGAPSPGSIVVGDSEADVEAAMALSLTSICLTTGVRDEAYLERLQPDALIESIERLLPALETRQLHPNAALR